MYLSGFYPKFPKNDESQIADLQVLNVRIFFADFVQFFKQISGVRPDRPNPKQPIFDRVDLVWVWQKRYEPDPN